MAQRPGNAQQHGGMQVMAAGVHHTLGFTGKGQSRFLMDRQRIDIGAQCHALPRSLSAM